MTTGITAEVFTPEYLLSEIEVRAMGLYDQGLLRLAPEEVTVEIKHPKTGFEDGPIVDYKWNSSVPKKQEALAIFVPENAIGLRLRTHENQVGGGFVTHVYDLHIASSGVVAYSQEIVRSRQQPEYVVFEERKVPLAAGKLIAKYTRDLLIRPV